MARKKDLFRAAWVLLTVCLLVGAGGSAARAGDNSAMQFVVVLDPAPAPGKANEPGRWPEAASILVHLLKEQDDLGMVAPGEPGHVMLPLDRLTREHRVQVLERLARPVKERSPEPLSELVQQALGLFKGEGPGRRAIIILSEGGREIDPQKQATRLEESRRVAALARSQRVTIFAVALSPGSHSEELQTLASASRGRFQEGKTAADLPGAILNFYQRVAEPQEVPIQGTEFRLDQWVRQAVVVAARSVPGQGVVLNSPAGSRITPRTSAKTVHWVAGQGYDLVTIYQPRTGIWRLAGARAADSRVMVDTDLTLTTAGTPREAGEDEVLQVSAALVSNHETQAESNLVAGTEFRAELQFVADHPLIALLQVPEPGAFAGLPEGARVGRLPPWHQKGEATLRVLALGKAFQRSVSLPIVITEPWYRIAMPPAEGQKKPIIRFEPDPALRPEQVRGTVTLQSAQGGLSGSLITPAPGSEIILNQPLGCQDNCWAELHLRGTAPGGRPLAIASGPVPKILRKDPEKPGELRPEPAALEKAQTSPARKAKRRWLWLALMGAGLAVLLAAGLLLWREGPETGEAEGGPDTGNNILRLQAQLENLNKEKAQLQATLEEKNLHAAHLLSEKADLQTDLERVSSQSKGNIQSIEELEKKLGEAEREAEGVQQEYMALYARNQQEKEEFKKK
jgi:hypothetical protein